MAPDCKKQDGREKNECKLSRFKHRKFLRGLAPPVAPKSDRGVDTQIALRERGGRNGGSELFVGRGGDPGAVKLDRQGWCLLWGGR